MNIEIMLKTEKNYDNIIDIENHTQNKSGFQINKKGVYYGKYIAFNYNNRAVSSALWHLSARDD